MRRLKQVPGVILIAWLGSALGACRGSSGTPPDSVAPAREAPVPTPTPAQSAPPNAPTPVPASSASAAAPVSSSQSPRAHNADSGLTDAGADAAAQPAANALALFDAEGKPLPQTNERPSTSTEIFRQRMATVAAAILSGDPAPALNAFFPLVAYQQVKDVAKPERDYKFRLQANFARDIREYHRALGRDAEGSQFVGVTVPESQAKWMEPGSEGNKLGYFRVLRSRLHFTLPTGRKRDFELTSLISWRGEWYVVHLHGFE